MMSVEHEGVAIDVCEEHGIWLDRGELEILMERGGESLREDAVWWRPIPELSESHHAHAFCPRCDWRMEMGQFEDSGIVLDRCRDGEGYWFDTRELEQLVRWRVSRKTGDTPHPRGAEALIAFLAHLFPGSGREAD